MLSSIETLIFFAASAHSVTISNKLPRIASDGSIVNSHDGNVVYFNGTYFLYGEWFGSGNYVVTGNELLPKLSVYTSPDLVSWTFQGLLHNNSGETVTKFFFEMKAFVVCRRPFVGRVWSLATGTAGDLVESRSCIQRVIAQVYSLVHGESWSML